MLFVRIIFKNVLRTSINFEIMKQTDNFLESKKINIIIELKFIKINYFFNKCLKRETLID